MNIAIIPARGGSKRIPKKNIKNFCGKPIIGWSIELAIKSGCFDKVIVSTDDEDIAKLSKLHGAEVPFIRSKDLADDYTGVNSVIIDAIYRMKANFKIDYVCTIFATAPLIQLSDIKYAYKQLITKPECDFAFSVTDYGFPIQRALKIIDNKISMFQPDFLNARSQDLEQAWHDAGQFYWGKCNAWLEKKAMFGPTSIPIKIPRYRVQDIDTLEDWERAELIFKTIRK